MAMRHGLWALLLVLFAAAQAVAQEDDEEQKPKQKQKQKPKGDDEGEEKEGEQKEGGAGMMDEGEDPAEKEGAEKGPYSPTGETGDVKEVKEVKRAEKKAEARREARKKLQIFGEAVIGWGGAPVPGPGHDDTTEDAFGVSFLVGGSYDFSPKVSVGLRVPWSTASFDVTPNTTESSQALGLPELFLEYRLSLGANSDLPIGLGVGVPIAQGNQDFTSSDNPGKRQYAVNLFADATRGWRDGELFLADRITVTPQVGLRHYAGPLEIGAFTKLVIAPNIGDELTNPDFYNDPAGSVVVGTVALNSVALRSVTGAGVSYEFLQSPRLFAGLDVWAVVYAIEPVEFEPAGGSGPNRFQFVGEPRLGAVFGPLKPSIGYIKPLGGRLGDADAQGIRIRAEVGF
jgi:hypothetical protein